MFEASPSKVIKVSLALAVILIVLWFAFNEQQRFRAFYCISFINIQQADCESCKMLI